MQKPNFSVALIARNEAKTLPRLIASLKEFQERGGEILLLDTGSTDDTANIARNLGCKVHEVGEKFIITLWKETADDINKKFIKGNDAPIVKQGDRMFDYAAARNYIAQFAENDMLATPDCDEIYTKFDLDKVIAEIESGVDQLEYNFVFSHDSQGGEMVKFMHCKFYNRTKMAWAGVIHEVLVSKEGVEIFRKGYGEDVIKLEHWQNHETNRGHYLTGLAYDCFLHPENDRNAHYLARELYHTMRFESAIEAFKVHIDMKKWPTERSQSMIFMGECLMALGKTQEGFGWFLHAFDLEPNRREPFMEIANHYYHEKKPDQVIAYVAAALQIKGVDYYANYRPWYEHIPHEMMYWALWQKGEISASKQHFDVCLSYQPFNPLYLHDFRFYYDLPKLSFVIPTLGRPEGLKKCIESIKALNYPQEKIEIITVEDEPRIGVAKRLKEGVEKSTGDWIVYASNDIEFTTDSIMCAYKTAMDNNKKFMAFNTQGKDGVLPDEGNICEHFMIHKSLIAKLGGEIFDTEFHHVGVDNLLWAKLKRINHAMRCQRAIVKHNHFSQTGEEMDEVYKIGWDEKNLKEDRELLAKKLSALNA